MTGSKQRAEKALKIFFLVFQVRSLCPREQKALLKNTCGPTGYYASQLPGGQYWPISSQDLSSKIYPQQTLFLRLSEQ
jgi:hypothetical protein